MEIELKSRNLREHGMPFAFFQLFIVNRVSFVSGSASVEGSSSVVPATRGKSE